MSESFVGTPYHKHTQWEGYDAIVIGSGIGGLTAAVLLAKYGGWRVLVLERHYTAGGFTHTFTRKGFEWDVGVHYIGEVLRPESLTARLFHVVTGGRVRWASLGEVYDRIVVGDTVVDFPAGREAWREALLEHFPHEARGLDAYIQAVREATRASLRYFLAKALPLPMKGVPERLLLKGFYRYADRTTREVLAGFIQDPILQTVLTGQYGDYGLPPGQSSFVMQAMLTRHYWNGAAYPVGGASVLAREATRELTSLGGAVVIRAEVDRILLDARGRAVGVRLTNGHLIHAPRVISDAGFATTFLRLLPQDHPIRQQAQQVVQRVGLSMAHLNLYVGLDADDRTLDLPKHNIWVYPGPDHDAHMARYLSDPEAPLPLVFISFGSARDPDFPRRYPGRATLQVITPARWEWFQRWSDRPWQRRGEDYEALKARFTERLLAVLYRMVPQVKGHVVHAELSTPLSTVHFTGHPQGAIYGLNHNPARFREPMLRPQTPIPGLYLTGADVATAGVAGALSGGLLTASYLLKRNLATAVRQGA